MLNALSFRLTLLLTALGLVSCSTSGLDVQVAPAASFGQYEMVWFRIDDGWTANHSIVEILQQELERRRYAVNLGEPPAEIRARSMILYLEYAGENKTANKGRIDHLGNMKFVLKDGATGAQLASAVYTGFDRDRVEQRALAQEIVDQIFGSRTS